MKTTTSKLKQRAKLTLSGNYGVSVGAMLISEAVMLIAAFVLIGTTMIRTLSWSFGESVNGSGFFGTLGIVSAVWFVIVLVTYLFMCGIRRMFLNMSTGQPFSIADMLFAYTHKPHKFLGVYFISLVFNLVMGIPYYVVSFVSVMTDYIPIMVILQILMYLLQIIGIIVYSLYFGMVSYLLAENPERKVIRCFRESAALMQGNKGRLFYLGLSFAGMFLLGIGSLGIGFLWIFPYLEVTSVHFYLDISAGCRQEGIIERRAVHGVGRISSILEETDGRGAEYIDEKRDETPL